MSDGDADTGESTPTPPAGRPAESWWHRRWRAASLRGKFLALTIPMLSAMALTVLAVDEVLEYVARQAALERTLERIVAAQTNSLTEAMWNFDDVQLESQLAGIAEHPLVSSIVVRNAAGEVVAHGGVAIASDAPAPARTAALRRETSGGQSRALGTLELFADEAAIRRAILADLGTRLVGLVVLLFGLAFVTILATARVISRPLAALQASIDRGQDGSDTPRVEWDSDDEIGRLVSAYNRLQASRDEALADVRRYQEHLEALVLKRTAALAESESRTQAMLDTSPVGLGISVDDKLVYWNARLAALLDLPAEPPVEAPPALASIFADPDTAHELAQRLAGRTQLLNEEVELTSRRGRRRTGLASLVRTQYDDNEAVATWFYDITDRKRREVELEVAKSDAEAATEAKSQFLATMSHEIRTPMNGVLGMTDLLAETSLDADQRQMLGTVRESGNALLRIINDILDFSKIEAGKLEMEQLPTLAVDLVEETCATLAPVARMRGIRLVADIDPRLPTQFLADPVRVRQVLFNLVGNAVKFSHDDGEVVVRAILNGSDPSAQRVRFEVRDQGVGMPPEVRDRLFQPFMQAESSTTRKFGGTGLGLAISRRLVEMMAGTIEVESEQGVGSTFAFELPLRHVDEPRTEEVASLAPARVLLVDASEASRRALAEYLASRGADVEPFDSTEAARQRIDSRSASGPEVVVVADPFQRRSALDLSTALRAAGHSVPVVLAQSVSRPVAAEETTQDVIVMPANPLRRQGVDAALDIALGRGAPAEATVVDNGEDAAALPVAGTLLVAEDNRINRMVIGRQLSQLGYAHEMAEDGAEALEKWRSGNYALLLSDCHMPRMDGYALSRAIRAEEGRSSGRRLPIIAITASALKGEAELCHQAGMDDYLTKPTSVDLLAETLERWLRNRDDSGVEQFPAYAAHPSEGANSNG